jgi:hypothetical protein
MGRFPGLGRISSPWAAKSVLA